MRKYLALAVVLTLFAASCGDDDTGGPATEAPGATTAAPTPSPATTAAPTPSPATTAAPTPTTADPMAPQRGGRLVVAITADVVSLDPVDGGAGHEVRDLIYDGLAKFTPDLEVVPDLAESWEADGTVWTFHLRDGVKFHDGTDFNADAVKAHFDRMLTTETARSGRWLPFLESVEVVDPLTVRFHTTFVDAAFPIRIASDSGPIPSPNVDPDSLERNPVGTGPFRFVEWIPDVHVLVERNPDFWGDEPYLDEVEYRPVPEPGSRVIGLQSGDLDVVVGLGPEQLPALEADPDITIDLQETTRTVFIGIHNLKEPFTDPRVRLAMNLAVDMEAIADTIYGQLGVATPTAIPAINEGYADLPNIGYDPVRAKELLTEAGYPDGFEFEMIGTSGRYLKDTEFQQAVLQQLREVGIIGHLTSVEFATYIDLVRQPVLESELVVWQDSWSGELATLTLRRRYHCDAWRPADANIAGYCNEEFSDLVDKAERELDRDTRIDLLQQAQAILREDVPSIFGITVTEAIAMKSTVHGILHYATEVTGVDEHTWIGQ